jgi:hypothetical protein
MRAVCGRILKFRIATQNLKCCKNHIEIHFVTIL